MSIILQVTKLSGGYNPNNPTIRNITMEVHKGEIVALIGLNGAGKSTTIKHILGIMQPTNGTVTINGKNVNEDPDYYRSQFAYIPETPVYYPELTLWEHLELTALVYGINQSEFAERVRTLLKAFNMENKERLFPEHFSKGMRQKMMIISALLIQPSLYIIDEPLMGLDPLGIRTLLTSLNAEKKRGAGILMSTHILSTAEQYCDRFILIHHGEIIAKGTLEDLQELTGQRGASLDEIYLRLVEDK
jgi:ABC-2 type transport system ATP-binding protein